MCDPQFIRSAAVSPYGYDVTTTDGRSGSVANNPNDKYYAPVKAWIDAHTPQPVDPSASVKTADKEVLRQAANPAKFDSANQVQTVGGFNGGARARADAGASIPRLGGVAVRSTQVRNK